MFRLIFTFVVGLGFGVALMDTLQTPHEKRSAVAQQVAIKPLANPIFPPDATVQHCTTTLKCGPVKRYYVGMVKR